MTTLNMLETHGCQGGAHGGYVRAGWNVTGVDINKNHAAYYPGELIIGDAAAVIRERGHEFHAKHTSPPCQWYCRGNAPRRGQESKWERTIPPIREALEESGGPYVIENVKDAVWDMCDPILLCGCMFDLSTTDADGIRIHLQRPRLFEINWPIAGLVEQEIRVKGVDYVVRSPRACDHSAHEWVAGAYGGARRDKYEARYVRKGGYVPPSKAVVSALLGFEPRDRAGARKPEMTWNGLYECLPPAYTEWVGTALGLALTQGVAA
tara:strand:+ start:9617 stop:10411 length:795 start_codon:yes stop_codon:yes gene_type:complete